MKFRALQSCHASGKRYHFKIYRYSDIFATAVIFISIKIATILLLLPCLFCSARELNLGTYVVLFLDFCFCCIGGKPPNSVLVV